MGRGALRGAGALPGKIDYTATHWSMATVPVPSRRSCREPRQARKGAAVAAGSGAEVRLAQLAAHRGSRPGEAPVVRVVGEVSERSKEHAWKVCMVKAIEGSNPSLSAIALPPLATCAPPWRRGTLLRRLWRLRCRPHQPRAGTCRDIQRFGFRVGELLCCAARRTGRLVRQIGLTPFSREELVKACEAEPALPPLERARRFYIYPGSPDAHRTGPDQQ